MKISEMVHSYQVPTASEPVLHRTTKQGLATYSGLRNSPGNGVDFDTKELSSSSRSKYSAWRPLREKEMKVLEEPTPLPLHFTPCFIC
jgi:hypothetical protein